MDASLKRELDERLRDVQDTIEEAERAKKQYRFTLNNLGANTDEEKVAAMLAHTAQQKYEAGRYDDAVDSYKRAINIAPRFSSLYRNWAVIESNEGHNIEADQLMEKAASLSSDDPIIWMTWGNMKRKGDKLKDALKYYNKALAITPNDIFILNATGQVKTRLGEYEEADELFRLAIQAGDAKNSIRHEIVNKSSLAENLRRWAESLCTDKNINEAEEKLVQALAIIDEVINLNRQDLKSKEIRHEVLFNLGFFYYNFKKNEPLKAVEYFLKSARR